MTSFAARTKAAGGAGGLCCIPMLEAFVEARAACIVEFGTAADRAPTSHSQQTTHQTHLYSPTTTYSTADPLQGGRLQKTSRLNTQTSVRSYDWRFNCKHLHGTAGRPAAVSRSCPPKCPCCLLMHGRGPVQLRHRTDGTAACRSSGSPLQNYPRPLEKARALRQLDARRGRLRTL